MAEITKEIKLEPSIIPPLDESIFAPSQQELEFLHKSISSDDAELKARVFEVQRE